jgi:enoyl-CoA hydratase
MAAVEFERQGPIAIVTINRPEARNSMNPEVMVRLTESFEEVRDNPDIRIAILTGSGDKAFCAGADLGQLIPLMTGARKAENEWDEKHLANAKAGKRPFLFSEDTVKPVIAAINGHAIAGGMELVQGTDIRVACPEAKFGVQEVKWALFPAGGSTVKLPKQIPFAKAMELLLTGDLITAAEALELGFLNYVLPRDQVLPKAVEIAEKIAANGPLAVTAIRKSARECVGYTEVEALKLEGKLSAPIFKSEDAVEGPAAFMSKRTPVFKGK